MLYCFLRLVTLTFVMWFVGMGSKGWGSYFTWHVCLWVHWRGFRFAGGTQQAQEVYIYSSCNFFFTLLMFFVLFNDMIYNNTRYGTENCSYFYDFNAHVNDMSRLIEGQAQYVIDATKYGNVSRFINHRWSFSSFTYYLT